MKRRRVALVAAAAVMASMVLPARASEPGPDYYALPAQPPSYLTDPHYPWQVVEVGQSVAAYFADLVTDIAPEPPSYLTDPDYPFRVVELGRLLAAHYADLVTDIAPEPPAYLTDPDYARRAVEVGRLVVAHYADLVTDISPEVPWYMADPDYVLWGAEVAKAYAERAAVGSYGGGAFDATIAWDGEPHPSVEACRPERAPVRGTVSITAHVAFSTRTHTFTGPLVVTGAVCGADRAWAAAVWQASGTDAAGNTLRCPYLGGVARRWDYWGANAVGPHCTLDGVALGNFQVLLYGGYGLGEDGADAVTGGIWLNTY